MYDEALDILTCTAWDGDLQEAKNQRSALAKLLGVSVPAAKKERPGAFSAHADVKARKPDEMESYESLVRTVGY